MRIEKKVTDEQVREIRERAAAGATDEQLANAYGISPGFVAAIRLGRARKRAGGPLTRDTRTTPVRKRIDMLERTVARLEKEVTAMRDAIDARIG